MKKEESFEQRDKLHSFVREHKPIPSFARSTCSTKKRKNFIVDIQRRKSICVIETNTSAGVKAKSSRKRYRTRSTDTEIKKYYFKSDESDYIPSNLESKRRKITETKNNLIEQNINYFSHDTSDYDSTDLKKNEELDEEKQEALNKAFFWRFRKLFDKSYFKKEMVRNRRKPSATRRIHQEPANNKQSSDSSDTSNINQKQLNNTQFENVSSNENTSEENSNNICLIKNNQNIPLEPVSALISNTNVACSDNLNSNNKLNINETNFLCKTNPCTLKAKLLASTTKNNNNTSNEPNCTITADNNSKIVPKKPATMENNNNNVRRVSTIESDVILCLANLKNFVNSEAAQLNDTISKIPLRSIVHPAIEPTPQINHLEPPVNPPYNIIIVNPANSQASPQKSTQESLFHKYIQNKQELTKNIRLFLEKNRKKFHELKRQRDLCITELRHAERTKDYFKVEWIKNRLQHLNHSIEKIKCDCKYDSSEINKFTCQHGVLNHQQMPSTSSAETDKSVTERIQREFNLRQEQLKFFSNIDSMVEGNRVLEYPFAGIITNTSEHPNNKQTPRDKLMMAPDHSSIPQYLTKNHTAKSQEKAIEKRSVSNNNEKILFKPYENTSKQKSQYQPHFQHSGNPLISIRPPPPSYNQHIFNNSVNQNPHLQRINPAIPVSQYRQHQFAIDQIMSKQHRNLNHPTYINHNIFEQPFVNPANVRPIFQQNTTLQSNHLEKQKNTSTTRKEVKHLNTNSNRGSTVEPSKKDRSSITYCAAQKNYSGKIAANNIPKYPSNNKNNPVPSTSKRQIPQKYIPEKNIQLIDQKVPLKKKPALRSIGVIRKLSNKVVSVPNISDSSTNNTIKSTVLLNEEIPNKRIKLDQNPTISSNTKISTNEEVNTKNIEHKIQKILNENVKSIAVTETTNASENNTNEKSIDQNKKDKERKTYLRLQFNLISNKTITLSYLLKMMNENLKNNSFSNFILKPKNIEELCNIIRRREIFSKIEENSPYQYPNVLTIMNHFRIYVIVCVQIENKINFKELYLKLIRDNGPIRYHYHDEPELISLENIDMYLQKAALEIHEAIILNSAKNNNNKCVCNKIETFTKHQPQNDKEFDNNYFIKAHGENEISIIVLYEPKLKTKKLTKIITQKCKNDDPPSVNTIKLDSDAKEKTVSQKVENVNLKNNFTSCTNLNVNLIKNSHKANLKPLKTLKHENQSNASELNENINLEILQLEKSFKNWEKILENPEKQRIVSEIFENQFSRNKIEKQQTKNNNLKPDSDNIWNDMEHNKLITMSEAKHEFSDNDNKEIRKRRISLPETCLEPRFKNIRINAKENPDKIKSLQNKSKILSNKQINTITEINNLKEIESNKNSINLTNISKKCVTEENIKIDNEVINYKKPDFAKINNYRVVNIDKKSNLSPSLHETITNYWKNNDSSSNSRTLQRNDEKNSSETFVVSIIDTSTNSAQITQNSKIEKINKENNKAPIKLIEIRRIKESQFEISRKYYDDPKLKISSNNDIFQKVPLDLTKPLKNNENIIKLTNNKQLKTGFEMNTIIRQSGKSHSNNKNDKRSTFKNTSLDDSFSGTKKNSDLKRLNDSTKFCINFNTLVYINEIDYQIILEILNEVAKPLYTFYKFVNTTRCNNNQPLINFTAFFFGLKFKKLQKYKKMYEELYKNN